MVKKILFTSLWVMGMIAPIVAVSPPIVVGNLSVGNYWIRPSTGPNTAAYLTITNTGEEADKLTKVECLDTARVELHNHIQENGVMKMRPVDFIEIGKDPVKMEPGGLHVMLMGLKTSFQGRETVPVTLHFQKAGTTTVDFPVKIPTE